MHFVRRQAYSRYTKHVSLHYRCCERCSKILNEIRVQYRDYQIQHPPGRMNSALHDELLM